MICARFVRLKAQLNQARKRWCFRLCKRIEDYFSVFLALKYGFLHCYAVDRQAIAQSRSSC